MGEYRRLCGKVFDDSTACILDETHGGHHEYVDLAAKAEGNAWQRARIATLEARIAELTREREAARGALDALNTAVVTYVRSSCDEVKRLRAERDEAVGLLRDWAADRFGSCRCTLSVSDCDRGTFICLGRRSRAYLGRLTAAPEKETAK